MAGTRQHLDAPHSLPYYNCPPSLRLSMCKSIHFEKKVLGRLKNQDGTFKGRQKGQSHCQQAQRNHTRVLDRLHAVCDNRGLDPPRGMGIGSTGSS